jgi:Aspartyl protease
MSRLLLTAVVVVILGACAQMPPERVERDRVILAAVKPCKERYAERLYNPEMMSVLKDGTVRFWYKGGQVGAADEIRACFNEATKPLKLGPWQPGRLANAVPASITITPSGKDVLVPVRINGVEGMMTVSTRSSLTIARADYAKRAGLRIVDESPSTRALINSKNVLVPYARARSVQVGEVYVEALHVVVHDASLSETAVDGVLGNSFLALFKVNVDRRNNRLTLEPIP